MREFSVDWDGRSEWESGPGGAGHYETEILQSPVFSFVPNMTPTRSVGWFLVREKFFGPGGVETRWALKPAEECRPVIKEEE